MSHTKEQLDQAFNRADPYVVKATVELGIENIIKDIGKKHGVHMSALGKIYEEVMSVLVGLTKARDFVMALREQTKLGGEALKNVVHDLNEQIFKEVREMTMAYKEMGLDLSPDEELIAADETPLPPPPVPIAKQKLSATVHMKKGTTDHRAPKARESATKKVAQKYGGSDPYREPV